MNRFSLSFGCLLLIELSYAIRPGEFCAHYIDHVFTNEQLVARASRIDTRQLSHHARNVHFGRRLRIVRKLKMGTDLDSAEADILLDLLDGFPLAQKPHLRAGDVVLEYLSILARHPPENYFTGIQFARHYIDTLGTDRVQAMDFYKTHLLRLWSPLLVPTDHATGKAYRSTIMLDIDKARPALDFLLEPDSP